MGPAGNQCPMSEVSRGQLPTEAPPEQKPRGQGPHGSPELTRPRGDSIDGRSSSPVRPAGLELPEAGSHPSALGREGSGDSGQADCTPARLHPLCPFWPIHQGRCRVRFL